MPKLTDTQRVILSSASRRNDRGQAGEAGIGHRRQIGRRNEPRRAGHGQRPELARAVKLERLLGDTDDAHGKLPADEVGHHKRRACEVPLLDEGAQKVFLANGDELIVLAPGQV